MMNIREKSYTMNKDDEMFILGRIHNIVDFCMVGVDKIKQVSLEEKIDMKDFH
jgi:hypothetical protein